MAWLQCLGMDSCFTHKMPALFEYADNLALYACHGQSCTRARTKQLLCKLRCPSTSSLMACHLHASEGAKMQRGHWPKQKSERRPSLWSAGPGGTPTKSRCR